MSYIIKGFTYYIAYERICSFILKQNYDKMYELIDRRRRDFVKSNNLLNGRINSLEELKQENIVPYVEEIFKNLNERNMNSNASQNIS